MTIIGGHIHICINETACRKHAIAQSRGKIQNPRLKRALNYAYAHSYAVFSARRRFNISVKNRTG